VLGAPHGLLSTPWVKQDGLDVLLKQRECQAPRWVPAAWHAALGLGTCGILLSRACEQSAGRQRMGTPVLVVDDDDGVRESLRWIL
jgi:hypothetical protein